MIQCFVENSNTSIFKNNKLPKLIHVCKAEKKHNKFPRIMHKHEDMLEIVFIRDGRGTHIIGDKEYKTKKGDILIYNKNVLHDERSNNENYVSTYVCGISKLHLKGLSENQLNPDNIEPVIHSGEHFEAIESLFKIMYSEVFSNRKGVEKTCNYLMLSLISIVVRLVELSGNKKEEEEYELGQRIKKYIDENFLENLSIKSLSKELGISQYYLMHTFKDKTGYSPMQYIIKRKIGEAQNLLINTDYSITEIAESLGYDNPNYFNMLFTKTIGMPPGKYRKYLTSAQNS